MKKVTTLTITAAFIAFSFAGCTSTETAANSSSQSGQPSRPPATTGGSFGGGDLSQRTSTGPR